MKSVSKVKFITAQFGCTKPTDGRSSRNYFIVQLLDDENVSYKFFVFEDTKLYQLLKSTGFELGQELIAVVSINSFNNSANLVSLELPNNGK